MLTLSFTEKYPTKNKVRFEETPEGKSPPKVETVYVPKTTLTELGWEDGQDDTLEITIRVIKAKKTSYVQPRRTSRRK